MPASRFGWSDLFHGARFLAPVSEEALLLAGRAAGFREGATLLELACGNGAVAAFLAEEFHLYARGVEAHADLLAEAQKHAERSPAGRRLRFIHGDPLHPDEGLGPVDVLCDLRLETGTPGEPLRRGGRMLVGRFVSRRGAVPAQVAEVFDLVEPRPPGRVLWRRDATPLEWERYFRPQERALRAYRARLHDGNPVSPVAIAADRQLAAFRAHGSYIAYEIAVVQT